MELLKMLSTSELVAQLVGFLILLFILRLILWKPFLKVLDGRKEKIAGDLKKIDDTKSGLENLKTEYQSKLDSIEDTARIKMQEAISEGKKKSEEIFKNAQIEAQQVIDRAKESIKKEIIDAKEDLKDRIVEIAVMTTENILRQKLTEEKDKNLIVDFVNKLDKI